MKINFLLALHKCVGTYFFYLDPDPEFNKECFYGMIFKNMVKITKNTVCVNSGFSKAQFPLLDPDPFIEYRIRIQASDLNNDPPGSETLIVVNFN